MQQERLSKNEISKSEFNKIISSEYKAQTGESGKDFEKLIAIQKEYSNYLIASTKAEIYKDIPDPKSGTEENGKQVPSLAEFKALGVVGRSQFKQQFPKTYEKYMGR